MIPASKTGKRDKAKRGNPQRSALERRVRELIEDVREAMRRGDAGAVDAILRLEAGAKALMREHRAIADDADAHRAQDDDAEDHDEGDPAT
jgi:hypothetical protein